MISIERQIGNVMEIKIPVHHGPRTGIQKSTTIRYVHIPCGFKEDFESPQQFWSCKQCEVT